MTSLRHTIERVLKGPVGGMFLCLLIAGFLGGVAVAHPGDKGSKQTTSESSDASEAPEAPEQDQGSGDASGEGAAAPHTPEDCQGALTDVQQDLPTADDATGLAHAIWVVEANCEKNPQAPGLVNALNHLVANWQKHQAHEAEKANAVHGKSGEEHGNSGEHGKSGEEHGNSAHGSSSSVGGS
jgi:hypothetical protein